MKVLVVETSYAVDSLRLWYSSKVGTNIRACHRQVQYITISLKRTHTHVVWRLYNCSNWHYIKTFK